VCFRAYANCPSPRAGRLSSLLRRRPIDPRRGKGLREDERPPTWYKASLTRRRTTHVCFSRRLVLRKRTWAFFVITACCSSRVQRGARVIDEGWRRAKRSGETNGQPRGNGPEETTKRNRFGPPFFRRRTRGSGNTSLVARREWPVSLARLITATQARDSPLERYAAEPA